MPLIQTRTLKTYYEMAGSGAPVLVLSGTGGDLRKKPNIMDSPLTAGFTVISYDQRGLGQSEKPHDGYTMANYAEDAVALMDALDIESAHVLGISLAAWWRRNLPSPIQPPEASGAVLRPGGSGGISYPLHELEHLDLENAQKPCFCWATHGLTMMSSKPTPNWWK